VTEIQMASGVYVRPYEPWTFTPRIEDVARHLAGIYRFGGLTRLTVAQHSVHVADLVPPADRLWALLHDAPEAYVGDMAAPLKHANSVYAAERREIEEQLMRRICETFGLPLEEPASVRRADAQIAVTERRDLLPPDPRWRLREGWAVYADIVPLSLQLEEWSPQRAEDEFLARFENLTGRVAA
jgi:hypothetical protein